MRRFSVDKRRWNKEVGERDRDSRSGKVVDTIGLVGKFSVRGNRRRKEVVGWGKRCMAESVVRVKM